AHQILREEHPRVAEALAVASLRVLSERFDDLERMFTRYIGEHTEDTRKVTEWAGFRARLFGDSGL
ncbi:MAG: Crp/Fnr family transcriptional regulator, partial [Isosphaeraceae bacterium]